MAISESASLKDKFLQGMSCAAATVNVVTTNGPAGKSGLTVSAMMSVSADTEKPTVLIAVHEKSSGAQPIRDNGVFAINVLSDTQSNVSDTFAGRFDLKGTEKFECGGWSTAVTGAPLLDGAVVSFDCSIIDVRQVGTHYLITGEVEHISLASSGNALVYVSRSYSKTTPLARIGNSKSIGKADDRAVKIACLNSAGPMFLPEILQHVGHTPSAAAVEIFEGDQQEVTDALIDGDVDISIMYDLNLPTGIAKACSRELKPHVLLPAGHGLATAKSVSLSQLAEEDFILLDTSLSTSFFLSVFKRLNIEPKIAMRSRSMEMVRSLVGRGFGYSMLVSKPYSSFTHDGKQVAAVPLSGDIPAVRLACATRPESAKNPMIHEVMEFVGKMM